jgi:hypothetical protein
MNRQGVREVRLYPGFAEIQSRFFKGQAIDNFKSRQAAGRFAQGSSQPVRRTARADSDR